VASGLIACFLSIAPAALALKTPRVLTQYNHAVWTQAQGLPQDAIRAITQTDDGYLWIGTDEGLSRFDGYDFETFTVADGSLPSNSIMALARGSDDALWIGTPEGLTRFYKGRFTTFTTKTGLPNNAVKSILEDHSGSLWIVAGPFLSRFQNGEFYTYPKESLLPLQAARVIYEDSRHTIWVTGLEGLIKLVDGAFAPVLGPQDLEGNVIDAITVDQSGSVWLGGQTALLSYRPNSKIRRFYTRGHPENQVRQFLNDRDGNLWAGTGRGVSRLNGSYFRPTPLSSEGESDAVFSLLEDREGNLWTGTENGLNRFHDELFTDYRPRGLPRGVPLVVYQTRKSDAVWVGYQRDGLVLIRGDGIRIYTTRDGLPSNHIQSIREALNGDLLITTAGGLSRMHAGHFSNFVPPDLLGRPFTDDVLEDRSGRLWLAAPGGVFQLDGSKARNIVPGGPVINDMAVVLAEGEEGSLWAGSYGDGLWQIKDGTIRLFKVADGLSSDRIRSLLLDQDGTLWIGTWGGGLNALRNGVFTHVIAKDGLLSDNIWHVEDDGKGSLWLSTPRGISRIRKEDFFALVNKRIRTLNPSNYGVADGLPSSQCPPSGVGGGGTRTQDGRLWFPTSLGLATIDPGLPMRQPHEPVPIVRLTEVSADNQNIEASDTATVGPGPRQIRFRFSAIYLAAPEQVRYEYMLEGLDRDWSPSSTRKGVTYAGLSHGAYHFRFRAYIPGQEPIESSLALVVLPHFYERMYFLPLCAVSALVGLYGVYRVHLRQIRQRFALVLDERLRIAREIHDTLLQGVVGISAQLAVALNELNGHEKIVAKRVAVAHKMAGHTLAESKRSLRDLRSFSSEDEDLAAALSREASCWNSGNAASVEVKILGAPLKLDRDFEQNMIKIAHEAVTNALNHADATRICIQLQFAEQTVSLSVKDDGRGFDPCNVLSLADGHFGLQGMRERAERFGARFDLTSKHGEGTNVSVRFTRPSNGRKKIWRQHFMDRMRTLLSPVRT
jgi:ligand-binding sensor domain-containing protein/anti-sigma regulatory factor (Ser/Thr protein kinase)